MKRKFDLLGSFEKMPVNIFSTPGEGSLFVAKKIADLIRRKEKEGGKAVIGLATGSTPLGVYDELVKLHKNEGLSFKNVITFNLDQYYPMEADSVYSYHYFMRKNLFDKTDIDPKNYHLPDGLIPRKDLKKHAAEYEQMIVDAGGIDLQILGIGQNGHIGFNEPGSPIYSRTRLITLDNSTRIANSRGFETLSDVPRMAITMGIGTIMEAKEIVLLAWGEAKAWAIKQSVEGKPTEEVPASLLQQHDNVSFVIDDVAASELTRFKSPWLTGEIKWTPQMMKRAVIEMALKLDKAVLSLTDHDYIEFGLNDLLVEKGDAYEVNLQVYYLLRDSITGWPGGKPGADLPNHPERSKPYPKRVIIFSPHPDDDIISMGGTFMRLHDQGHDVHVAYQTSGNIAVTDEFVTRFLDFATKFEDMFGIDNRKSKELMKEASKYLKKKSITDKDSDEIRSIKGLIRRTEARATCKYVGLKDNQIHFLNLPFYETGTIKKNPMSQVDVDIVKKLIRKIKPHQIFCAGDFADPHGTHKVCFDVVAEALKQMKEEGKDKFLNETYLWLYKGAWQEWAIEDIEMAIPMSPGQVRKKRYGIFIHQSQKDAVPFQGDDEREFWQRAEERNANTANLYARLGMTKYAAIEAFVRWKF